MSQPRPTAEELLTAVREFLDADVMPQVEGRVRYHTRVAMNVLDVVVRELADGPDAADDERRRLGDLLGETGTVEELSRRLAAGIRAGEIDIEDAQLLEHLRATAADDVAIANPRHAPDRGDDVRG